jgi:hypothetical protein
VSLSFAPWGKVAFAGPAALMMGAGVVQVAARGAAAAARRGAGGVAGFDKVPEPVAVLGPRCWHGPRMTGVSSLIFRKSWSQRRVTGPGGPCPCPGGQGRGPAAQPWAAAVASGFRTVRHQRAAAKSGVPRWAMTSRLRPRAWSKSNSSGDLRAGNRAARMRPSPPWDSRAATSRCRQAARSSSCVQDSARARSASRVTDSRRVGPRVPGSGTPARRSRPGPLRGLCQGHHDQGPCLECVRTGAAVVSADLGADRPRWPLFASSALAGRHRTGERRPRGTERTVRGGSVRRAAALRPRPEHQAHRHRRHRGPQ